MLVRFSVENYLSFRDRAEISLVAGKVRRHPDHVVRPAKRRGIPLLKVAIIYGANASGKSNLIKAMESAKHYIVQPLPAGRGLTFAPFKIDRNSIHNNSRFEFEIKVKNRYFAYGFSLNSRKIEEEWLYETGRDVERVVFDRKPMEPIVFGDFLFRSEEERQFLQFTAKGIPHNRLFLTEYRERRVGENVRGTEDIESVLNWFEQTLTIVFPHTKFQGLALRVHESQAFKKELARYLKCFDTGIEEIDLEEVPYDKVGMTDHARNEVEALLAKRGVVLVAGPANSHWVIHKGQDGVIHAKKLIARHGRQNGTTRLATFEMNEESDGTLRLMDLAPSMMTSMESNLVVVIDELDRSLHPDILHSYISNFVKYSLKTDSQLIVTTHDTTLLNQKFLRRDEFWFVSKGKDQSSRLVAMEEYKLSNEEDLQRDYLHGRFGGVPVLQDFSWLGDRDGKGA